MIVVAGIGILLVSSLVTLGVLAIIRWLVPLKLRGHEEHRGWIFAFAGVLYALVVGFVLAFALDGYKAADQDASSESNSVIALSRVATLFDAESRDTVGHELICYSRAVIDDEWPAMRDGRSSDAASAASDMLFQTFARLGRHDPDAPGLDSALERTRELGQARASRLLQSEHGLPAVFWLFMVGGGLMLVAYAAVLAGEERWVPNFFFVIPVTILLMASIYLVAVFEQPFRGPGSIEPDAMRAALVSVTDFIPDPQADRPCP